MSSGHQRIKWRRNIAENFNRLSKVHERYRQTTDGRTTTYSEREHEFTFAKNQRALHVYYTVQEYKDASRIKCTYIYQAYSQIPMICH